MTSRLIRFVVIAVALLLTALVVPDIVVEWDDDAGGIALTLGILALVFGLINTFIRPIARIVSIPLNILSLGLFSVVINAALLLVMAWLVDLVFGPLIVIGGFPPDLGLEAITTAAIGSFIISAISAALNILIPDALPARTQEVDMTQRQERQLVASGSPYERTVGFSRAVRVGDRVMVAGTAPIWPDGHVDPDPEVQARLCLEIMLAALDEAGATSGEVVRTRSFITDRGVQDAVGRAHGAVFGDIRPASTMVVVAGLVDDRWWVEMEAEAIIGTGSPSSD